MSNSNTSAVGVQQTTLAKKPDLTTNLGEPPVTDVSLSDETNTRLAAALALAQRGFRVFPVIQNDKKPYIKEWPEWATHDAPRIQAVWGRYPILNIGCFNEDLILIDVDTKAGKHGAKSLALLEALYEGLPLTYTQRSASGGYHFTYRAPPQIVVTIKTCSNKIVGFPDIDIRAGRTGYIVGAGSSTAVGEYTVEKDLPIADAPQWLIDLLPKVHDRRATRNGDSQTPLVELDTESAIARAADWLENNAPEAVQGAGGDAETYKVACHVKGFGISPEKCLELMLDHWNDIKASPPWKPDELEEKVANAYRYGQDPPGIASAEAEFGPVDVAVKPAPTGWHDPADLWERETAPRALPAGVVPSYIEWFAGDRARRLGVTPGAMAAAAITTLSSLVPAGNNLHLRQHSNSWFVKCTLWMAFVGDPGVAKSPALNAAMAFPKAVEAAWRADFKKACEANEFSAGSARRRRKRSTDAIAKPDPDPKETTESFADDPLPQPEPQLRRKIVNDATTEAIGAVLAADGTAAPVLLHSDELAGFINSMDAYRARGGKDRPFFLQAKDGGPYAIDRKATGTVFIPSLAISIAGTIQDKKLAKIASELTDDGLLQRFALIAIERTGSGEDFPDDVRLNNSVDRVAIALSDLEARDYRLAPEAAAELAHVEDFAYREAQRADVAFGLRTWLSKTPNEFGRYCLTFHLIEWASGVDPALEKPPAGIVSLETARRARRYIEEFLYPHAAYIYSTVMAMGNDDEEVRWVAAYILTRDLQTITAREIGRAYRPLGGAERKAKLLSVMATLAMQDWVKLTNETHKKWKVNPAVHDGRFAAIKLDETERRAAVKAEIARTVAEIRAARGDF